MGMVRKRERGRDKTRHARSRETREREAALADPFAKQRKQLRERQEARRRAGEREIPNQGVLIPAGEAGLALPFLALDVARS